MSENYWRRRFAADPAIVGKTVHLNGVAVTIIGVTPHDFTGTGVNAPAFWLPLRIEPLINADKEWLSQRENRQYRLCGRLAPGVTITQATAQIALIANHLRALHNAQSESALPATVLIWPGSPFPLPLSHYGGLNLAVLLIMSGAATVLAVASANVGSLQLARARSRETELRTRLSLGATRARVIRQLLTENTLIGLLAGVLALLLSSMLLKAAVKAFADAMPVEFGALVFDVTPDLSVFAYAFLISLIAGILSGITPAIQSPQVALTFAGRASTASVRGRRLQGILVAVQVGLSLVLMVAGTMFFRGAINSVQLETGYDSKNLVQVEFQFPKDAKYTAARKTALVNEFRTRMADLPGVTRVTSGRPPGSSFRTAVQTSTVRSILNYTYVQSDYFETVGIRLLLGAGFEPQMQNGRFVLLSESAAKQIFGDENPLGRRVRLGVTDERMHSSNELAADGPTYQVIGVVRDTRGSEFDGSDSKQIYLPLSGNRLDDRPLLIRVQSNPVHTLSRVERVIASIDSDIVVTASTIEEALRRSPPLVMSSLAGIIASSLGLLGLLLALAGILGTVSHIVTLRTREVGIRMAVGAQQHDVLWLILRESAQPVLAGLGVGVVVAAGVVYLLRGILYGINAIDGIYFLAVHLVPRGRPSCLLSASQTSSASGSRCGASGRIGLLRRKHAIDPTSGLSGSKPRRYVSIILFHYVHIGMLWTKHARTQLHCPAKQFLSIRVTALRCIR